MNIRFAASMLCVTSFITGCMVCGAVYDKRVEDLEIQRDIYASRAQNWQTIAIEREETISQQQDEIDGLNAELKAASEIQLTYAGVFSCTAYCAEEYPHICGEGHGVTSSGAKVQPGVTVAADTNLLPYGTIVYIEGVGLRVVQDTGSMVKGETLDVAVNTHTEALSWAGYGTHRCWVVTGGETP